MIIGGFVIYIVSQLLGALWPGIFWLANICSTTILLAMSFSLKLLFRKVNDGKRKVLVAKIKGKIEQEKAFLDPNFSLSTLSSSLGATPNEVSRTINDRFLINFSDYVNEHRVQEVIRLLEDSANDRFTLEAISKMAGFKSTTSFNSAFKKVTGKTPSHYKKMTRS